MLSHACEEYINCAHILLLSYEEYINCAHLCLHLERDIFHCLYPNQVEVEIRIDHLSTKWKHRIKDLTGGNLFWKSL